MSNASSRPSTSGPSKSDPPSTLEEELRELRQSEETDTVDVWNGGYRLPNQHWTKEGTPPHRPSKAA